MSIEVVLEGNLEKETEREMFSEYMKQVCEKKHIHIEDYDKTLLMDICPEGFVECSYEGTFVSIAAQTNVAGPGFHAFVCSFFDEVMMDSPISLEISDPTKYYEERNFENLKYQYFYRWLADIAIYIKEHQELRNLCISWPMDTYQPIGREGYVVTPMGYIAVEDFTKLDVEALAERFFIWNEQTFTAEYYRNCALSLLWKECYFTYSAMNEVSDKYGNMAIDYMEAAYDVNDQIALPMDAYEEICEALQREPIIHQAPMLHIHGLGYRKELVSYPFGNWGIVVDGCSEQGYDQKSKTLHFMAPYKTSEEGWRWLIKANAFVMEEPSFAAMFEENYDGVLDRFELHHTLYDAKGIVQQSEDYITMTCEFISGQDVLYLDTLIRDRDDLAMLKDWMNQVEHREVVKEEEATHS